MEENRVTVLTWPTSYASQLRLAPDGLHSALPSEGHSALRTYTGNHGNGIYASFWPDKCKDWNKAFADDPDRCHKDQSHFHTQHHDALTKNRLTEGNMESIDLYGLNVEAINKAFNELHDGEMNSLEKWSWLRNCSDVTLFLLEKGGIFERVNFKRYGWKTITTVGIISCYLSAAVVNALYDVLYDSIIEKPRPLFQTLADAFFENFGINTLKSGDNFFKLQNNAFEICGPRGSKGGSIIFMDNAEFHLPMNHPSIAGVEFHPYRPVLHTLFDSMIGGIAAFSIMYLYSIINISKYSFPVRQAKKQALYDAASAFLAGLSGKIARLLIGEIPYRAKIIDIRVNDFLPIISPTHIMSQPILTKLARYVLPKIPALYRFNTNFALGAIILAITLTPLLLVVFSSFIYSKTTKPRDILNFTKNAKKLLDEDNRVEPPKPFSLDTLYQNKYKAIGTAGMLATLGFFAYRNPDRVKSFFNNVIKAPAPKPSPRIIFKFN